MIATYQNSVDGLVAVEHEVEERLEVGAVEVGDDAGALVEQGVVGGEVGGGGAVVGREAGRGGGRGGGRPGRAVRGRGGEGVVLLLLVGLLAWLVRVQVLQGYPQAAEAVV